MRTTVNLDSDLYALAKSFSQAEACTLSAAVNQLLRRSLPDGKGSRHHSSKQRKVTPPVVRNGFTVSQGTRSITPELVSAMEAEDDLR